MLTRMIPLTLFLLSLAAIAPAQDLRFTKTGKVYFDCTGGVEKIEATNKSVVCALDTKSGAVQFSLLMKGFEFEKALMMEHFNENYVESDLHPKSEFSGKITNNAEINYAKDGTYTAKVTGKLKIHGVTRDISTTGKVLVQNGKITVQAEFSIVLEDYKVAIPALVKDKIAKNARILVDCFLESKK